MATILLAAAGGALGAGALGPAGAVLGRAAGGIAGGLIDQAILGGGARAVETRTAAPRLMASREGAAVARVYGRMRVGGQVIWAGPFRETAETASSRGPKGAPRSETRTSRWTVSLAVALCEGPVDRVGRVWADGNLLVPRDVSMRLHRGGEDQAPDPLIEAAEGEGRAPAYRGTAYVVFEDLDLGPFGNRVPQFSVEVFREPRAPVGPAPLSALVEAVALSPGSGEFSLDVEPVRRVLGPGRSVTENVNSADGRADALVALDQLEAEAPACRAAALVVSWFGDDLRCGRCRIEPRAEEADKATEPVAWTAGGIGRAEARTVGRREGRPVYGGTPSDRGVIATIRELKRRGIAPMFYPFVLMDVAPGNGLPDPYGGAEQPAYPWRGRITLDAAPGRPGSADGTAAAAAAVAAFFGGARAGDFVRDGESVRYVGPAEWGLRRFVLHYAHLCAVAGGVDAFCVGSELRGLTWIRSGVGVYPAVAALRALAAEVRSVLGPATKIGYAADWSEYFGHQPADGSGDVFFHLDPLWADPTIDFVGIDNYMPLADWRDGDDHADAAAGSTHALGYLQGNIEGGEGFDWFYASAEDRRAQRRSPIADGAHGEDWVFRYKDIRSWWSSPHHDRPGGVRSATPTEWVPRSKPIWFTELGCPAIDKGANQPNVFVDPKSVENAIPHFSTGARDEHVQRRFLQAQLGRWGEPARNPASPLYGGPMVDVSRIFVWTWDLRPWPDFPQRTGVWADGPNHRLGHWITGRLGSAGLAEIVAEICAEAGVEAFDVSALEGVVDGFAQEATQTARQALQPLMLALGFDATEADGLLRFRPRGGRAALHVAPEDCAVEGEAAAVTLTRAPAEEAPEAVRIGHVAGDWAYEAAAAEARAPEAGGRRAEGAELPIAMADEAAAAVAERWLREAGAARETARFALPPSAATLEPGDVVSLETGAGPAAFRVERIEDAGERRIEARRLLDRRIAVAAPPPPRRAPALPAREPAEVWLIDAPTGEAGPEALRPLVAAFARPWPGPVAVLRDEGSGGFAPAARAERPATMGRLAAPLAAAAPHRWARGEGLLVRLFGGALASRTAGETLNGANAALVEGAGGRWEAIQFADAELVGPDLWRLSTLLRGQLGTEDAIGAPTPEGARFLLIDGAVARLDAALDALGLMRRFRAGPAHLDLGEAAWRDLEFAAGGAGLRPLAPAHLRARPLPDGALALGWVRRTRAGGDGWGVAEPPLGEESERWRVRFAGAGRARVVETATPSLIYPAAERAADGAGGPVEVFVAQMSASVGPGAEARMTIHG